MRAFILCAVLLCIVGFSSQQYDKKSTNWEGTWSTSAGTLYLCVDIHSNMAYGQYGGVGLISGYLYGYQFSGYFFEAGYDRPFGPVKLTINAAGNSFSGTYKYWEAEGNFTTPAAWTGTKSSSSSPDRDLQCLFPATLGQGVGGTYGNSYVCDHSSVHYLNTKQPMYSAYFESFGKVEGYSSDHGTSLLLSDFQFPDDDDSDTNRATQKSQPGGKGSFHDSNTVGNDDDDEILTSKVVIGRAVSQTRFCGFFWYGFYAASASSNQGAVCFDRTTYEIPDPAACSVSLSDVREIVHRYDDGQTSQILEQVQDAINRIIEEFPYIYIFVGVGDNNNDGQHPDHHIPGNLYVYDKDKAKRDVENGEYVRVGNSSSKVFAAIGAIVAALFFAF